MRTLPAALVLIAGCAAGTPAPVLAPGGTRPAERILVSDLDHVFGAPVMSQTLWGVEVKSLDTGRVVYERNARMLLMPASNMKIVTLAVAAETLGWDYRFTTVLETAAPIENGALKGDLIVRGGGDPTINTRNNRAAVVFDECAAALKAAGITRIDGNIVGDGNAFEPGGLGQGWSWDYLQYGYAAPASALELNENTAALTIRPGPKAGDQALLELPPGTGLGLLHHVQTGEAGTPTTIQLARSTTDKWLDVTGSIAADAKPETREIAVATPTIYFAHSFLNALIARGIAVGGLPLDAGAETLVAPGPRRVLADIKSPSLREIATVMMKVSQNLYAETLLKAAGAAQGGLGTAESGRVAARQVLGTWGIPQSTYVEVDGSGLSRYDYVTADMIVTILEHMFRDPKHHDAFLSTLPIGGKDGTVASRMKGTRAEGNALAKTGTIANVRALSGYVKTRDGETLAFSMIANNFTIPGPTVTWGADLAVETLANYSRRE